jgi:prepilin-type processing-associated H-X9-DG protein
MWFTLRTAMGLVALTAVCSGASWFIHERQVNIDREQCRGSLYTFALAVKAHQSVRGAFPRGTPSGENLSPEQRLSWVPLVLNWTDCYQSSFLFERDMPWNSPVNLRRQPYLGRGRQFAGAHPGGAMVAFADGSVRFLPETIAPTVFEAIATIAGGEVIAEGWDRQDRAQ